MSAITSIKVRFDVLKGIEVIKWYIVPRTKFNRKTIVGIYSYMWEKKIYKVRDLFLLKIA